MGYYTNIYRKGNVLYTREIIDGKHVTNEVEFKPTIWSMKRPNDNVIEGWSDIYNKSVYPIKLNNMGELFSFNNNNTIHTPPSPIYQFINEYYPNTIEWKFSDIRFFIIDIETEVENEFPNPEEPNERIQLITIKDISANKTITFGLYPYHNTNNLSVKYIESNDEASLLRNFMALWTKFYPDCITGWSSDKFDMPYLYNRIVKILGEDIAKKLSPYNVVNVIDKHVGDKTHKIVNIAGIAQLDYLALYKKFSYNSQESYTLGYITSVELGETKVDNPYENFKEFYTKDKQLFIDYNIQDVELIHKLENKMKLLDLALTIVYDAKIQYEDIFSPIKTWDVIIYNYLNNIKKVIPIKDPNNKKTRKYGGGYCKKPLIGRHNWVVSLDVTSLYPSLIMAYQVSPEKLTNYRLQVSVESLLEQSEDLSALKKNDLTMTANGCCFEKGNKGILPTLIQQYFDKRTEYNKELSEQKQLLSNIDNELRRRGLIL